MNPAMVIIVLVLCVLIWFLISFLFKPIGRLISKIGKDTIDIINEEEPEEKTKRED